MPAPGTASTCLTPPTSATNSPPITRSPTRAIRNKRWLRLDELVDLGYVHEVWYFLSGAAHDPPLHNFEVIELKPQYNANFVRLGLRRHVQAGNGGDPDEPWTGRSLRIGYVNASRGVGCFVHSLGHGLEGTCNSGASPTSATTSPSTPAFDFRQRYGMPFNDLYGSHRNGQKIRYENNAMIVPHDGQWLRIPNYVAAGGNVHFPPNGRETTMTTTRSPSPRRSKTGDRQRPWPPQPGQALYQRRLRQV